MFRSPGGTPTLFLSILAAIPFAAGVQAADDAGNRSLAVDLAVVKTVDDPSPNEGGTIVYTVALSNNGPDTATGVTVTDLLPAGVTFVSSTQTQGTYTSGTGVWSVGTVAVAASDLSLIHI